MDNGLYKEKSSTADSFLVAKSDNIIFKVPDECQNTDFLENEFNENTDENSEIKLLKNADQLKSFAIISIRPDMLEKSEVCKDQLTDIAVVTDKCAKEEKGFWILKENIFSLLIPSKNNASGIKTAKEIRHNLSLLRKETVSIGIANYPEINYTKKEIVENSIKALDHAAFFEGNAIVSFDSVSLNISGDKYYQEGEVDKAIDEFQNALKLSCNNVNVKNSLGICFAVKKRYDEALKEFEEAIYLSPNEIMPIFNAGLIYSLKGDREKAFDYFLKADSFEPHIFEIKLNIAKYYFEKEEFDKASEYLETALKIDESQTALYLYSECLYKKERFEEAVKNCRKAVKLSPNNAKAISLLGELFFKIKENTEITILFAKHAVTLEPDNGKFRKRLARIFYSTDRNEEALLEFETASSLGEDVDEYLDELKRKSA